MIKPVPKRVFASISSRREAEALWAEDLPECNPVQVTKAKYAVMRGVDRYFPGRSLLTLTEDELIYLPGIGVKTARIASLLIENIKLKRPDLLVAMTPSWMQH